VIFDADIDKSREEVPDIFLRVDLNHLEHRLARLRNIGIVIDSAGGGVMGDSRVERADMHIVIVGERSF